MTPRRTITILQPLRRWYRAFAMGAILLGLVSLSGTREFDAVRSAAYFLRTRKSPAVSMLCVDQETQRIKERHAIGYDDPT